MLTPRIIQRKDKLEMGSVKNRVCVLTSSEVADYLSTGIRPLCTYHEHLSKQDALVLTRQLLYTETLPGGTVRSHFEFIWVRRTVDGIVPDLKFQAITCIDRRRWTIRKSGGYDVHQLVSY
jgi:hypothetical protein